MRKKNLFFAIIALACISTGCKKEAAPEINKESAIVGSWQIKKKTILEKEEGSTWKFNEISVMTSPAEDEWINKEITFSGGRYLIEYYQKSGEKKGLIVKHNAGYTLLEDTVHMEKLNFFPAHNAYVEFNNTSSMNITADTIGEDGIERKVRYLLLKQKETYEQHAFETMEIDQYNYYICSEVNGNYVDSIFVRNLTANGAMLQIGNDPTQTVQLTKTDNVLYIIQEPDTTLLFEKSFEETAVSGGKSILYYDADTKEIKSTHNNDSISNSVGKVLFWKIGSF